MQVTNWRDYVYAKKPISASSFYRVPEVLVRPDSPCDAIVNKVKVLRHEVLGAGLQFMDNDSDDAFSMHFIGIDSDQLLGAARLVLPQSKVTLPLVRDYPLLLADLGIPSEEVAQIDMYVTVQTLRRRSDDEIEGVSRRKSSLIKVEQGILSRNYLLLLHILKKMFATSKQHNIRCLVYSMSVAMQETFDALSIPYQRCNVTIESTGLGTPCIIIIEDVLSHFYQTKSAMATWFLMR